MNRSVYNLEKLFAATTYAPFLDKIVSSKDEDLELKNAYRLALSGLNGLYEFREGGDIKEFESEGLKFEFQKDEPNFFKIGVERLEIQQVLENDFTLESFTKRFFKLNQLHNKLFNNKVVKFGLVKYYKIAEPINHSKFFNSNSKYLEVIDNCKNFVLIKRDGFNINLEYTYSAKEYFLRIDINDIVKIDNYYELTHFEDIIKYHDKILVEELEKIFGGKNE